MMSLRNYRGVTLDAENGIVLVKAGTNLGQDPHEPLRCVSSPLHQYHQLMPSLAPPKTASAK